MAAKRSGQLHYYYLNVIFFERYFKFIVKDNIGNVESRGARQREWTKAWKEIPTPNDLQAL